ncbi:MAG TPA: 30S ribosomal protein S20 [Nitrospiria bacterium]|nr:30S ribosomal protein S20 [Nitrospiria bacterium]
MPIHRDAIKKARQDKRKNTKNKVVISALKTGTKKVLSAVSEKNKEAAQSALHEVTSAIDSAASKGVLHHGTAARKVSRLTVQVNKLSAK